MNQQQRTMSLRLPEELAADAELVARIWDIPMTQFINEAIAAQIDTSRYDPEFKQRLRAHIERDRCIIERLAST